MNLSATVYKPNRQYIPASPTHPIAVRVAQADAKAHPTSPTQPIAVRVAQAGVKAHPTLRHNRPQRLRPVGKPIHKQTSSRPKRPKHCPNQPAPRRRGQNTAQTSRSPDAAGRALPKPARPQTPSAKRRSNPQDRPTNPPPQAPPTKGS